jgi:hypothetical protein
MMNYKSRLNQLDKRLKNKKDLKPRKLEDYFLGSIENTCMPKVKKSQKTLMDYFKGDCCEIVFNNQVEKVGIESTTK